MPKHGGCWNCGDNSQQILQSVTATQHTVSEKTNTTAHGVVAVCDKCKSKIK